MSAIFLARSRSALIAKKIIGKGWRWASINPGRIAAPARSTLTGWMSRLATHWRPASSLPRKAIRPPSVTRHSGLPPSFTIVTMEPL
ncbi:MAG: hypothetical protein VR75_14590 [Hyphomonadaceae bacterium BRH_c29]|nr:MAG: hypothetical protein VR75_14590 [Hyphomonadaceae bacterium BRH_c29]